MASNQKKSRFLGFLLGLASTLTGKSKKPDLRDHEFRTSTSKIGLTFTEQMRDYFRKNWLKKR